MQTDCFPEAQVWPKSPIRAIADINPRYPVKKDREYPFIEMAAVAANFGGIKSFDRRKLEGSGLSRFKVGDTLFAKITPCPENGKVALVESLPDEVGIGSTEFIVLSPNDGCDSRFLYYLVSSHAVRGRAAARMEGSTGRQRVPDDVFEKRLLVPIPSSKEQAAIARILNAVDTAIERTGEKIAKAQNIKIALVQKLFSEGTRQQKKKKTQVGFVPESWDVLPVDEVALNFQYGLSVPMQLAGTLPILRMGNIQNGDILLDDLKFVSLPGKVTTPYLLKRGDVLFNRTNSQELVGKIGVYRLDEPAVFASYLIRVIPNPNLIDNYYLGQVLNSYSAQCRIKRYATPGVQQVNINATNLGKVLIPVPIGKQGIKEQQEIAELLEQADESIRSYKLVSEAQQTLKRSLMYDLLTGKVNANNPSLDKILNS
jgi:type I restriction enzyme S subunit